MLCNLLPLQHPFNMKKLIIATTALVITLAACSASKKAAQTQAVVLDTYGTRQPLEDTFLHRLQQENDLVLAAWTESLAWGRHYNYTIAARKNNVWQGYAYVVSGTINAPKVSIIPAGINADSANAAAAFAENAALWTGKDDHSNCTTTVSDGTTSYLMMVSGEKVLQVSYYMPDVYQRSCPDSSRQLFLEAFGKVKRLASSGWSTRANN